MTDSSTILKSRFRKRLLAALLIGAAGFAWGLILWKVNLGKSLRVAAYDLSFVVSQHEPPPEIVLIHIDEASHDALNQPLAMAWDRKLHARMVHQLAKEGAKLIVFDILFQDEFPEDDGILAEEMRKHGNVILAGEFVENNKTEGAEIDRLLLANPTLRRAASGWGLTSLPLEFDGVVRRIQHLISTPFGDKPSLSEVVRMKIRGGGIQATKNSELINYYGGPDRFTGYSYAGVLEGRGIPSGAFRDKIVIIGAKQQAGLSNSGKDMFPTPYSRKVAWDGKDAEVKESRRFTSGMEIQATVMGNLIHGRRIHEMDPKLEFYALLAASILFASVTSLMSPLRGVSLAVLLGTGMTVGGILAQVTGGIHCLWTIPVFGQLPLIASLSLGGHYFIEYAGRWRLRRAFKSYMSEEQARLIDEDSVSLELGGKEVEATIFFSDLAGFTSMSEGLPPRALSNALISYFERATEGILDNHGTIIKYIGDAVIATWGVPVKTDREADRAIDAAIQMQVAGLHPVLLESDDGRIEKVLETRVGIHTGIVLAGNLGSRRRFDYTVIGDAVNIAARLEGLNKMLGASVLVSESALAKCEQPERFLKRKMGSFILKGKKQGIVVFEILGYRDDPESAFRKRGGDYLEFYQQGLDACLTGDLAKAIEGFSKSVTLHDRLAECPASRLYLDAIEGALNGSQEWRGDIVLDSK